MDPEVQEREELAAKWQAAIDSIEAAGLSGADGGVAAALSVANGVLTAPPIDGLDPSLDPDIVAAPKDSIQAVNQRCPTARGRSPRCQQPTGARSWSPSVDSPYWRSRVAAAAGHRRPRRLRPHHRPRRP